MMVRSMRGALAVLVLGFAGSAGAQNAGPEYFVVAGGLQQMPGADGANLATHWITALPSGTLSVGAARTDLEGDRWTLMSVGASRAFPRGWNLATGIDIGPAVLNGESERFAKMRAEASIPVSSRWSIRAEESYVDVYPVSGHLVSGAVRFAPTEKHSFDFKLTRSIAGNLDDASVSFRFDYRGVPPYLMAGIVAASSNNRLLLNTPGSGTTTKMRQGFVGLTFPIDEISVTVVAEIADIGDARRTALSASLRLPVDWLR